MIFWKKVAAAAMLTAFAGGPALAQSEDPEQAARYRDCMALAEIAPDEALEQAQTWEDLGGSDPARHCAAPATS